MKHRTALGTVGGLIGGAAVAIAVVATPAGATTTATPTTAATAPSTTVGCDAGPWGRRAEGEPHDFAAGERGGDYLWHDTTGFHLRVTHRSDDRQVYTGVITASAPMRIDPVRLEAGDVARLSPDRRSLYFAFVNYGHIDGVDFHTDCANALTISHLNVGNQRLTADRVYLGTGQVHPTQVPFTLHRRDHT